jgi:hypothetical protein
MKYLLGISSFIAYLLCLFETDLDFKIYSGVSAMMILICACTVAIKEEIKKSK